MTALSRVCQPARRCALRSHAFDRVAPIEGESIGVRSGSAHWVTGMVTVDTLPPVATHWKLSMSTVESYW